MQVFIPVSHCKDTYNFDKTKQFSKNYLLAFVFSRENRRPKGAKSKHIFKKVVQVVGLVVQVVPALWRAHWVQVVGLFGASGPAGGWLWSSGRVFRPFCPLSRFVFGALLANMPLFRVLRGFLACFGRLVWVYVALVLCVACGAFVCVRG